MKINTEFNAIYYLDNLVNQENQGSDNYSDLQRGTYNVKFVSAMQGHYTVKITKK